MNTVKQIKSAISQLSESDLTELRTWFDELDAKKWDEQFEADVKAGKLDDIAAQAIKDFKTGKHAQL